MNEKILYASFNAIFAYAKVACKVLGHSAWPMHKTLYTSQYKALLTQLRSARKKSGLTQRQLADKLKASQDEISKCETGVRRLDVIELKLWVEALGLRLPEFLQVLEDG